MSRAAARAYRSAVREQCLERCEAIDEDPTIGCRLANRRACATRTQTTIDKDEVEHPDLHDEAMKDQSGAELSQVQRLWRLRRHLHQWRTQHRNLAGQLLDIRTRRADMR